MRTLELRHKFHHMTHFSRVLSYWRSEHSTKQLPAWRQAIEMVLLYVLRRIGPGYYIQARWGRRSIAFGDKWDHMNRYEYLAFIDRWNPPEYQKASQHKLVEKAVLNLTGFPVAPFVGYVHHLRGRGANGASVQTPEQLAQLLTAFAGHRLCFKRAEGFGGFGFASYIVETSGGSVALRDQGDGSVLTIAQWWERDGLDSEGYVIEEYLKQHPVVARINSTSVNTARIWVVCTDRMKEIVGCYLRIGRASSQVDNISSGGLVCSIDIATGRLRELVDPRHDARTLSAHPDSKLALQGYQLPDWERTKRLALDAISAFPHIKIVGLDVAFEEAGPVLIELNVCPDYVGCARMDMPLKQLERRMRASS
jgi:Sugar-transfer associated ATP-grasp